ncbi:hypothetical protein GALMADRAFT_241641 [Galerina marginata CBS 339.88]|uniref:BTB domain-containing protein n=1 Tax=Galerina marginata (strain CBS 339.88) TaxID=685588 RepID=A0A067TPY2_GALM3|nr:hypothetical protein GALMADRAFT_241641 [Galerina marginata CBS 339.88]
MTLLHDYFNTRNLQGFQRLLDGGNERGFSTSVAPSSSSSGAPGSSHTGGGGGKSWNRAVVMANNTATHSCDVNAKDWLGRTVLHLVCTALEGIEYARALLKHSNIDINLSDTESMWTPLHRALYSANLPVALLLLQHPGIDPALKDLEGYTAFDLYNSTVNGTKPNAGEVNAELFTWGANRNAALGLSDGNDRTYPDHVVIASKEDPTTLSKEDLAIRFSPIHVRQIQMSKLHTAVVTEEGEGNLRLCGFGSGGRLGPAQHTQYSLKPLPSLNLPIQRVALGQDHTLALTTSGEVYSWGLNRFSQLGYVVELSSTATGRHEEPIQSVPKRVVGLLRREVVIGVAASKNASACWTKDTVFTWGTNTGHLGYDKNAHPVQIAPRPVTKFSSAVIDLAMSDTVLVALIVTRHVECIWNDRQSRISFPMHAFPTGIEPYRPPQSVKDSCISKVTCCDDTFAALSSNGEVFTFSPPSSSTDTAPGEGKGFKPQRVWALRKKFSAVKDVALGSDGSIIICTESGHVFIRTRNAKSASGKAFKFERVPFLQRVTQVCANSTGSFGALRVDYEPKPIQVVGNSIAQDLKSIQPYLSFYREHGPDDGRHPSASSSFGRHGWTNRSRTRQRTRSHSVGDLASSLQFDDEPEDAGIEIDILYALDLCDVLACEQRMRKSEGGRVNYDGVRLPHGADTMVHVQSGAAFPVHRAILGTRSHVLAKLLAGSGPINDRQSNLAITLMPPKPGPGLGVFKVARLSFSGVHPLSVLILLQYFYSDQLLALWDRRVSTAVERQLAAIHANPLQVKTDLQFLAKLLDLPVLTNALDAPVKREPVPSMSIDMKELFDAVQIQTAISRNSPLVPDVVLLLQDKEVYCHSAVLRARSPLFASFFDLEDWTAQRWDADGMIRVNLRHLNWHVMRFVLAFMCYGADGEMFRVLDFVNSVENLLQFMFDVLAAANELLLDRLVLLCSSVILIHSNISNACYVLADATHYHVQPLVEKLQEYISANMESFLESHILDEIPYSLVKQLAKFVMQRQIEKSPFSRSDAFVKYVLAKHAEWLASEDIPEPIVRSVGKGGLGSSRKDFSGVKLSPPTPSKKVAQNSPLSGSSRQAQILSPQRMLRRPPSGDEIFMMDVNDAPSTSMPASDVPTTFSLPSVSSPPVWKAHGVPRVDMKAVMAEAASQNQPVSTRNPATYGLSHSPRVQSTPLVNEGPSLIAPSRSSSKSGVTMSWRVNTELADTRTLAPSTPPTPTPLASSSLPKDGPRPPVTASASKAQFQQSTTPGRSQPPGLGPVITPSRQTPSKSGPSTVRSASGGKVWNQPPTQPVAAPSPPTRGMSFVAIQHSQQEQVVPVKDKRSLREIQEEERALQAEADFLKWWTAEEERVQQEAQALAQFESTLNNANKNTPNRKPRHSKPKTQTRDKAGSAAAPGVPDPAGQSATHVETPRKHRKPRQKANTDS